MSLLMDALRKAEKARRERLEREQAAAAGADSEARAPSTQDTGVRSPSEPVADAPLPGTEETSAMPATGEAFGAGTPEPEAAEAPRAGGTGSPLELEPGPAAEERGAPGAGETGAGTDAISFEDSSATLPSFKTARASVDRYFDDSPSQSLERMAAAEGDAARDESATLPRQRGAATRTRAEGSAQRAAQTVFMAKTSRRPRRVRNWLPLLLVLLIFVLAGAGGWYYWQTLAGGPSLIRPATEARHLPPQPRTPPPVAAARSPAPSVATAPPSQPGGAPGSESVETHAGGSPSAVPPQSATPSPGTPGRAAGPGGTPTARAPAPSQGSFLPGQGEEALTGRPPASTRTEPGPGAAAGGQSGGAEEAVLPPGVAPAPEMKISHKATPPRVQPQVASGYAAFQRGDYAAAERAYRRALAADGTDRNALLGLAAVAVREQHFQEAQRLYGRVLALNPRDAVAQAAILGLQGARDPVAAETRIKLMLEDNPNAAYLYFTLGNLYAAQSHWPAAQAAYFNAFAADNTNADYALNLAVSLDHLGKYAPALDYYKRALALARKHKAGFAVAGVEHRIHMLSGVVAER